MSKETEISPVGLLFYILALIIFTFLAYKITGDSILLSLLIGPIVAVLACRPANTEYGNKHFLWIRDKKSKTSKGK